MSRPNKYGPKLARSRARWICEHFTSAEDARMYGHGQYHPYRKSAEERADRLFSHAGPITKRCSHRAYNDFRRAQ
jgi:hypothetical protein